MTPLAEGTYRSEFISSFDVWLKWCSLRLYETNLASLKKSLKFLQQLVDVFSKDGDGGVYHMNDYEASVFLPHLVEKFGHKMR